MTKDQEKRQPEAQKPCVGQKDVVESVMDLPLTVLGHLQYSKKHKMENILKKLSTACSTYYHQHLYLYTSC